MANWGWPEILDEDSARDAAHKAGGAAAIVAGVTTLLAVISMASGTIIMGINGYSLVDAALFGLVAWQTWQGSRIFAVAGLSLYSLEILYNVVNHPPGIGILTIIILLALINGVRGTFGLHKFEQAKRLAQESMMMSQPTPMAYQAAMPSTSVPPPPMPPEPPK